MMRRAAVNNDVSNSHSELMLENVNDCTIITDIKILNYL